MEIVMFCVPHIHRRRNQVKIEELQTSEIKNGHAQTCTRSCAHDNSTYGSVKSTYVHD